QLWPDQAVSDAALESAIKAVRHAVGDSGRAQWVIQTSHGHGYRFVATIDVRPEPHADRLAARPATPSLGSATPPQGWLQARPRALLPLCPRPGLRCRACLTSPWRSANWSRCSVAH